MIKRHTVQLSIVSTLYMSEKFLPELYSRLVRAAEGVGGDFEVIFVNDGSPDNSLQVAIDLQKRDPRIKVVDLSRNFGHAKAILAGLSISRGHYVFLIDSDLEEEPEWLASFLEVIHAQQADVVYGVQESRNHSAWKNMAGRGFYRLFNRMTEFQTPAGWCTVRLMRRRYVDSLLEMKDQAVYLGGLMIWVGFKQVPLSVQKLVRRDVSTYTFWRRVGLAIEAIVNFSTFPLRLAAVSGLAISLLSIFVAVALVLRKLIFPESIAPGYASIILSIWFFGGVIIMLIGVMGLYISRLTAEAKQRPQFIIRSIYQSNEDSRMPSDKERRVNL